MRLRKSLPWPLAAWTAASAWTAATTPAAAAPASTSPAASSAAPVPAQLHLEWTAPSSCPSATDVRTRVETALRRPTVADGPAAADGPTTRVKARVTPGPRGFSLVLETRAAGSALDVRRMEDRRCGVLADATAVIVATAIDEVDPNRAPPVLPAPPTESVPDLSPAPAATDAPATPAPNLSPAPAPAPDLSLGPAEPPPPAIAAADDLSPAPARPPQSPAPPRLAAALRLAALGDRGSTPGLAGGLTGGVGLLAGNWRLDLAAVWLAPRPTSPRDGLTAHIGVLAAQLRGCAVPRLGSLEFPVCLGFEAGGMRGRGSGDAITPANDWRPWLAVVVGPTLAWRFTRRLALLVQADLVVPVVRPSFTVDGFGEVYRAGQAAGRAGLGLEVKFP